MERMIHMTNLTPVINTAIEGAVLKLRRELEAAI